MMWLNVPRAFLPFAALALCGSMATAETGILTGNSALGPVLTNTNGMTLYVYDWDYGGVPACYGDCAANWPPLIAREGAQAEGDFRLMMRADGTMQWTSGGRPLYLWINDKAPGDVTGDEVRGIWHVAQPAE